MLEYNKTIWEDRKTLVDAKKMNNIEEGIYNSYQKLSSYDSQLLDITDEKGYITTKILHDQSDFNTLVTNGKYRIFNGNNSPKTGENMFLIEVISTPEKNISQIATLIATKSEVYYRTCVNQVWGQWEKVIESSDIETINQTIEGLEESLNLSILEVQESVSVIEEIVGVGQDENTLADRVQKNEEKISAIEPKVETFENDIRGLKDKDSSLDNRLGILEGKVTSTTEELEGRLNLKIEEATQEVDVKLTAMIEENSENLEAHKVDALAHQDIRSDIGNVASLLTKSKEVVGAINELYLTGGVGGDTSVRYGKVVGSEEVLRITAETTTNTIDAKVELKPTKIQVYLMGKRIFNEKDFSVEGSVITLKSTILEGEYVDILFVDEILIDITNNTMVETHYRYIAEEQTTEFTAECELKYGFLDVFLLGVRIYEGYDFTVNKETNTITLKQQLEVGDYVDYSIRTNTGMDVTTTHENLELLEQQKENLLELETIKNKVEQNTQEVITIKPKAEQNTQDIVTIKPKVENSIASVEETSTYNTIKIVKTNGESSLVKIKTMGGGEGKSSIKLYESGRVENTYQATSLEETSFDLPTKLTDNSYVELYYKSLRLINGEHYTVSSTEEKTTVNLNFTIKQGEIINYIIKHASYEYSDLNGTPDLSDYANKNETEVNLPISTQGETIATKIKTAIERGNLVGRYRYTSGHSTDAPIVKHGIITYRKTVDSVNTNVMFLCDSGELFVSILNGDNGTYTSEWKSVAFSSSVEELDGKINVLSEQVIAYGTGIEKTTEDFVSWNDIGSGFARVDSNQPSSPSIYHQAVLSSYFDSSHGLYLSMDTQGELYCSHNKNKWKQIATTDKTEILLTPNPSYSITQQGSYKTNGEVFIDVQVEKSDGGNFVVGNHVVSIMPFEFKKTVALTVTCLDNAGGVRNGGNAILEAWNKTLKINIEDENTKFVWVTGRLCLS